MENFIPDLSYSEVLLTMIWVSFFIIFKFLINSAEEITIILMEIRDNVDSVGE